MSILPRCLGIGLGVLLLSGCVVGSHFFISNNTASVYADCLNQSLNPDTDFINGLMVTCHTEVTDAGACSNTTGSYWRCKALLDSYSKCSDLSHLRADYVERCMYEN